MVIRWLRRIVVALVAAFVVLYCGDWAVYRMRGSPQQSVTVRHYLTVPLKGGKSEFDFQGSNAVPCSVSLFSQDGESACWQLRRNAEQNTKI
jgi:hypothetical protein